MFTFIIAALIAVALVTFVLLAARGIGSSHDDDRWAEEAQFMAGCKGSEYVK
jgi:hypothetical protein